MHTSPSVYDISLPSARISHSHMPHCLLVWSQLRRPLTHTYMRIHAHRSSVCHCITLHSLWHTVHIYKFITMEHFVRKKPSSPQPLAFYSISPRPWLLHISSRGYSLLVFTLLGIKLCSRHKRKQSARKPKPIHTAEMINAKILVFYAWISAMKHGLSRIKFYC